MDFKQFIAENTTYLYETLRELCAIPAPSSNEGKRAEYCKAWLEKNGAGGVYIDAALNVIFPVNTEGSDSITVYSAHTDTVFPDLEPMPYREENGRIYCPGVGDDTASVCVLMMTAKYFVENNIKPDGGVLFVMNSCEEGLGNLKGTRQLFTDYDGRIKQFVTLDSVLEKVNNNCVGSHRYKVSVKTQGGHSYQAFGSRNAIAELAKIACRIYEIDIPVIGESRTTYNVGIIEGGTSINTIAEDASMLCEYRSDNVECLAIMQQKFGEIFAAANAEDAAVTVEKLGDRPCADIDEGLQKAFCDRCTDIIGSVLGTKLSSRPASTDCNIPLSKGIPAICMGVYNGEGEHTRDEWIDKASLVKGLEVFLNLAAKLLEN